MLRSPSAPLLALCLVLLAGCRQDTGALQVLIPVDADVQADCVALELLSPEGEVLQSETFPRSEGRGELRLAVYRGGLPEQLQLRARALWGPTCVYNGRSEAVSARFEPKRIGAVSLRLSRPPPREDADGDGFVTQALGGPDCADTAPERHPRAQEVCDASADLDCDGLRGCDDAQCRDVATCARVATSLRLEAPVETGRVEECVRLTVTRLDADGRAASPGYATEVTAALSSGTGLVLYRDAQCGGALGMLSIGPGTSSAVFYARGERATQVTLTARAEQLEPVSLAYTLLPGRATQLVFTSGAMTVDAGLCVPLTLERRDRAGGPTYGGAQTLTLKPAPTAQAGFYLDPDCQTGLSQVPFPAEASVLTLYFRGEKAGTVAINAAEGALSTAPRNQTIRAGPAARLAVSLNGTPLLAGECSPLSSVLSQDAYGNASLGQVTVNLNAPAEMNVGFYSNAQCTQSITTTSFRADAKADFYFRAKTGGVAQLSASTTAFTSPPQPQTILDAVRTGTCDLAAGASTVDCPMPIRLRDRNKSFLVFQATTTDEEPRASYVRCFLKDVNTIGCARYNGAGGKVAHIQWQVVELAVGLSVQHFVDVPCITPNKGVVQTIRAVDRSKSFLLFSSSQDGAIASSNDFVTAQILNDSQVEVRTSDSTSCDKETFSLQVVTFEFGAVFHGKTGSKTTSPIEDTSAYSTEEASRSVLLSTFQAAYEENNKICNRMVRGDIGPPNKVSFFWGNDKPTDCNAPGIPTVAWERILLPPTTLVQTKIVSLPAGQNQTLVPLTPMDMTRTLLLASTQISGGQANGETDHLTTDVVGVATARLRLASPTQLEVTRDVADGNSRWTVHAIQLEL